MIFTNHNSPFAAVFLDFENLHYHLKTTYYDPPQTNEVILEIIRNLRAHLTDELRLDPILFKAYADFERMAPVPLGSLYLMGIDTMNVLGTEHKNAADMRLCIDLMEVLYTRQDVGHFVLVAGDRDYIPLVQHLRRQAKKVTAVAFRETLSGDLLEILGKENLIEADTFVKEQTRNELLKHRANAVAKVRLTPVGKIELPARAVRNHEPEQPAAKPQTPTPIPAEKAPEPVKRVKTPPPVVTNPEVFLEAKEIRNAEQLDCLKSLLDFLHDKNVREVWLSPFLRKLTDDMPFLAEYERKELIKKLELTGAIKVEKREGDPYPYSVIVINYNHKQVKELY